MKKKIGSCFLMILIVAGISMSVLNFSTKAYADPGAIWGTTWRITGILLQSIFHNRWLTGEYYCIDDARNCVIVFAN